MSPLHAGQPRREQTSPSQIWGGKGKLPTAQHQSPAPSAVPTAPGTPAPSAGPKPKPIPPERGPIPSKRFFESTLMELVKAGGRRVQARRQRYLHRPEAAARQSPRGAGKACDAPAQPPNHGFQRPINQPQTQSASSQKVTQTRRDLHATLKIKYRKEGPKFDCKRAAVLCQNLTTPPHYSGQQTCQHETCKRPAVPITPSPPPALF